MQLLKLPLLALLTSWCALAHAQNLPISVQKALRSANVPTQAMSAYVAELSNTEAPRLLFRENEMMQPASVMKIVTTFAALEHLGADYTWKTQFLADGKIDSGVLNGNLVIKGSGDPKWVVERIEKDFSILKQAGLHQIKGDLVLDRSSFQMPASDPNQFDGDPLKPYNATPDGLLVNFKSITFTFSPPDPNIHNSDLIPKANITSLPPLADVQVDNTVPLSSGACGDWKTQLAPLFLSNGDIHFGGSYAAACGERTWSIAYPNPDAFAAHVLKAMLQNSQIELLGKVRFDTAPKTAQILYQGPSLPLSSIIQDVNKYSNNVMAQQVFLTLGLENNSNTNFINARQNLNRWWREKIGSQFVAPVLENGSGLSRIEKITASSAAQLLKVASLHPQGNIFLQSLPIVGVDGTAKIMGTRLGNSPAIGKVFVKTGTLRDVIAIAGYAIASSGKRYIVVGMINHDNASMARPALDALIEYAVKDEEVQLVAFKTKKKRSSP